MVNRYKVQVQSLVFGQALAFATGVFAAGSWTEASILVEAET